MAEVAVTPLIGAGAHGDSVFDAGADCDAFSVPAGVDEPALLLLGERCRLARGVVFRSRRALLSRGECAAVLRHAEAHAAARGGWGTVRHSSVPTTDVAVEDVPALRPWLRALLRTRLLPMLAACFPQLAGGETMGPLGERVRVHDAFIVRYDEADRSLSLPAHSDTSAFSFTVALNGTGVDDGVFQGGGTWFRALGGKVVNAAAGHAVAFAGPLWHCGHPISGGTRHILVLFLYVEGFDYGRLIGFDKKEVASVSQCECEEGQDPDKKQARSFVVYNETHELVTLLT